MCFWTKQEAGKIKVFLFYRTLMETLAICSSGISEFTKNELAYIQNIMVIEKKTKRNFHTQGFIYKSRLSR